MYLVTAKQMQNIDRAAIDLFGISGLVLMENAGKGAVDMLLRIFPDIQAQNLSISILAGRGNNGGDAFVMARYLMEKGITTHTFLFSSIDKVTGDAKVNLILLEKLASANSKESVIEIPDIETFNNFKQKIISSDIFIDGILGTGLNSDVKGLLKEVIETINSLSDFVVNSQTNTLKDDNSYLKNGNCYLKKGSRGLKAVFSIDIPSGVNADTGQIMGVAIKATATATFGFPKIGHLIYPGKELTGTLEVIDIGIPKFIAKSENPSVNLIEQSYIEEIFRLKQRKANSHKGNYGHLLLVAGSIGKTGAAALASNAAMASGAGLVTLAVPEGINSIMEPQVTETMTFPLPENQKGHISHTALNLIIKTLVKDKRVVAAGPGLGVDDSIIRLVHGMVEEITLPMVLDADALNAISVNPYILKSRKNSTILTPHPGEMARLTGKSTVEIQQNRVETAINFAIEFNVIVVLKGASTIVALPDATIYICPTGNSGMASGGMGDVLTGMIAGFIAQGFEPSQAAIAGVYIHGLCGDIVAQKRGAYGFVASDIIKIIPETIHFTPQLK
ncbi:MAG: NAD(P)H-hydrate dehydratase [Desulfamplus sp.]|nr:NAD(P)H-hydrate dehydratase [Desulfamplus sp.]